MSGVPPINWKREVPTQTSRLNRDPAAVKWAELAKLLGRLFEVHWEILPGLGNPG